MQAKNYLLRRAGLLLSLLFLSLITHGSHFRYGTINWEITSQSGTSKTVKFTITQSWRQSAFNQAVGGTANVGSFNFGDGTSASVALTVTSINSTEDWFVGTTTLTHTYNSSSDLTAFFYSCCRISSLADGNSDDYYRNETVVTLSKPANSSPVANSLPVYYIQTGLSSANIQLSALDPDGDALTYSWATPAQSGLTTAIPSIANSLSSSGLLSVNTSGVGVGTRYAMQAIVTDPSGARVPIDFIIQVVQQSNPPAFDYAVTPANGTTYKVAPGQAVNFTVKADDSDPGSTVSLSASGIPVGASFATPSAPSSVSSSFSWTPSNSSLGSYVVNFAATDNNQVQTTTTVNIVVSLAPEFIVPPTPQQGVHNVVVPGNNFSFTAQVTDPDPLDVCQIISLEGKDMMGNKIPIYAGVSASPALPTTAANTTSTTVSWTPAASQWGHRHIFITAEDSYGDQTVHEVSILVNTTPTITSTAPTGTFFVGQPFSYTFTATDPDVAYGDALSILSSAPLPSWLTLVDNGNGTATLSGTPTAGGSYNVSLQVEDINHHMNMGGIPTQAFTLNVSACVPLNPILSANAATCNGNDGSITSSVALIPGETASYSWTGPNGFTANTSSISGLVPGTYSLSVTSNLGCSGSATATVTGGDAANPVASVQTVGVYLDAAGQATIATPAVSNVLFSEDFSSDAGAVITNSSITNWNVTGQIDVGGWNTGLTGQQIDLAGFYNGAIESKQTFTLTPGNYVFSFRHIRNTVNGNSVRVEIGSLVDQTFASTASVQTETVNFTVTSTTSATIKMTQLGPNDANGSFVDDISLTQNIPAGFLIDAGSSDDCGIASITVSQANFTCADVGNNTITLTVTDNAGKTASANATVFVYDTIKPVVSVQNASVQLDQNGQGSIALTDVLLSSSDICGIASESASKLSFDCSDVGVDTVVVTVTDNGGQITQREVYVTVLDVVPIVANTDSLTLNNCAPITFSVADLVGNDVDFYGQALTVDFVDQPSSGTIVDNLDGTFTYTPGSSTNHTATTSYVVKRNDGTVVFPGTGHFYEFVTSPGISWPAAKAAAESMTYNGQPGYLVTITSAAENSFVAAKLQGQGWMGASDAQVEGQWKWVTGPEAGTQFYQGQGNAFGFAVNGMYNNWSPGEPNDFPPLGGEDYGHFLVNGAWNDYPTQIANINGYVVEYGGLGSNCVDQSTSTGTLVLTLEDITAPVALASPATIYLDASGMGSITAADVDNGSNDACGIASISLSNGAFSCANVGTNNVVFTATDVNGNSSTAPVVITVMDTVSPSVITQNIVVQLDATGNASITTADVNNGSSDACGIASMSLDITAFTCANVGPNTVTLSVVDNNGNSSSQTATVTVEDNVAPVAIAQDVDVYLDASGAGSITAMDVDNGSNDACGVASISVSASSFACANVGVNPVVLTVTDVNGNVSTANANVNVHDTVSPEMATQNVTVYLDANGSASITTADIDAGSSDACGINSLSLDITSFGCDDTGANTVVLTAVDANANSSSASAQVTVLDTIAPMISCVADFEVCENDVVIYDLPMYSDNCNVTLAQTDASGLTTGMVFPVGVTTIEYTATDASGNQTSCSFDVTVRALPAVSIATSELPEYCQGGAIVLSAVSPDAVAWSWSNGDTNPTTEVFASGTYYLTVTNQYGCINTDSVYIDYYAEELLSSYTIIGRKEVHLMHDNEVVNGGVGVMQSNKKAKIYQGTDIVGATTFVMADNIDVKQGGNVTTQISGTPNISLPTFLYASAGCSNNKITVPKNGTLTLNGTSYGKIYVKEGGTLIFTQSDVSVRELKVQKNGSVEFTTCAYLRVYKKAYFQKNSTFNPDGYKVWMFLEKGNADVHEGSVINASIYALDGDIKARGKSNNTTYMNGMFIGEKVKGQKDVIWNWDTNCDSDCSNAPSSKNNTPIALEDDVLDFDVLAYPNPYVETFTIDLVSDFDENVTIMVHNMNGQVVEQYKDIDPMDNPDMGRGLPAGMYFVTVTQSGQTKTVKVNKLK
ncbi:MAG: hypothetical protein SchgKO_23140 [Schleiferiaceae bacterium]